MLAVIATTLIRLDRELPARRIHGNSANIDALMFFLLFTYRIGLTIGIAVIIPRNRHRTIKESAGCRRVSRSIDDTVA